MWKGFDFRVIFIVLVNWKIFVEKKDGELIDLMMYCYSKEIFFLFIFIEWKKIWICILKYKIGYFYDL